MALELLPDGTFKKLSKVQTDALDRYYKRENKRDLTTEVIAQFPIILATSIAAAAYVFRENILEKIKEEGIGLAEQGGLGLAKVLTFVARGFGPKLMGETTMEPRQPETTPQGNVLTRCQRYEADYVADNELHTIPFGGTVLQALAQFNTIQKMKKEGCSRPSIIPESQWKQG